MAAPMLAFEGDYSAATFVICSGALYGAYLRQNADSSVLGSCGWIVATLPDPVWEMGQGNAVCSDHGGYGDATNRKHINHQRSSSQDARVQIDDKLMFEPGSVATRPT
ncbi:hypothetical protein RHMOL_Rhmol05G0279200 [Rhododendron molle]|uniref:Uncharacterized protein n=1 Tax=Rhododendron molle TaxID=49168 RepID=A0ACC0NTZ8_RHOML|nr:hypothetical protein RHMOL_Rhmol05G0279200 [Rhododendron molle]